MRVWFCISSINNFPSEFWVTPLSSSFQCCYKWSLWSLFLSICTGLVFNALCKSLGSTLYPWGFSNFLVICLGAIHCARHWVSISHLEVQQYFLKLFSNITTIFFLLFLQLLLDAGPSGLILFYHPFLNDFTFLQDFLFLTFPLSNRTGKIVTIKNSVSI